MWQNPPEYKHPQGEYTIVMTVVLTSQSMSEVSDVSEQVRAYLRLQDAAREGLEWNNMEDGRRGVTVDDVVPAKIVSPMRKTTETITRITRKETP